MAAINESAGWARGCSSPRNNSAASRDTSRFRCFLRSCTHLFLVTQLLPNEKRRPKVSYSRAATFQRKCGPFPLVLMRLPYFVRRFGRTCIYLSVNAARRTEPAETEEPRETDFAAPGEK